MKPTYSIDAPDQHRLKVARLEIEAVLKKHDLAGVVVLHTPGMAEFFYDIRPSYSCVAIDEEVGALRVRSRLQQDYQGDQQAQQHDQAATANMVRAIADNLQGAAGMFVAAALFVDRALRAEHWASHYVVDPSEAKPQ